MSFTSKINSYFDKPTLADFYFSFSQIHNLLDSGMPVQNALQIIGPLTPNRILGTALSSAARYLDTGASLSEAFSREKIFPQLVAPVLAAGDAAGQLSNTFLKLSETFWLQHNLYSKVKNALFVPKLAAVMMVIMVIAYIKFAIPEYLKLYQENNLEFPAIVTWVSWFVNLITDYWPFTLIVLYMVYQGWKSFAKLNKKFVDQMKLKMPIYKNLHFYFLQHQMVSVLDLMLSSGLKLTNALSYAANAVENSVMSGDILQIRRNLINGFELETAIKKNNYHGCFDKLLIASLASGQKSNHLLQSLANAAKFYERALNNMIEPVSTKITFLVMIPMGMFIVAMFLFTMIPMFSYMSQITNI